MKRVILAIFESSAYQLKPMAVKEYQLASTVAITAQTNCTYSIDGMDNCKRLYFPHVMKRGRYGSWSK